MGRPPFDYFPPHFYYYNRFHRRFGLFRRFFWFSFGGMTALAFARYHGHARFPVEDGPHGRGWENGCRRVAYTPHFEPRQPPQNASGVQEKLLSVPVQAATGQPLPVASSPPPGAFIPPVEQQWETISRHAGEHMTGFSESAIDSMIASLVSLKSRIASSRTQRQQSQHPAESQSLQPSPSVQSPNSGRVV